MKVSKLDFYYRDLCIFNIVNQLIRELHLTHLYVTRYKRAKIQKLSICISLVGKKDLKKIIRMKKIGDADWSRTSKIRCKSQRLNQLRQPGIYDSVR